MRRAFLIALAAAAGMGLWAGSSYYKLVKYSKAVPAAWAPVETDLQARYDRIPGLLIMLKEKKYGYFTKRMLEGNLRLTPRSPGQQSLAAAEAGLEAEIRELAPEIIRLRAEWNAAKNREGKMSIAPKLDSDLCKLESLLGVMDDANYMRLNNNIPWAIELYNRAADSYNATAASFPGNILVRMLALNRSEELMPAMPSWFYGSAEGGTNR